MKRDKWKDKGKIKQIFRQSWEGFLSRNKDKIPPELLPDIEESVNKMLGCGDPANGFAEYICLKCNGKYRKIVPFTCKSRFCTSCGKVYIDKWVDAQVEDIIEVAHRHYVYTIPEEFREFIYWDRKLIKLLSDVSAKVTLEVIRLESEVTPGIITAVHTFGRDLKFNPHVHALVTEGGLDRYKTWQDVGFVSYEALRKKWQYHLCKGMRKNLKGSPKTGKINGIIDKLYKEKTNGFYVNAEKKMKSARGAARYIGRYLARPAIAEWRILEFNEDYVKFFYKDHETGEGIKEILSVDKFIGLLISHIPPKSFKMVRKYGLYSVKMKKMAKKIVSVWKKAKQLVLNFVLPKKDKKTYRERLIECFGKDPVRCPCCGNDMELWKIWHPKYGDIYNFQRDAPVVEEYEEIERKEPERTEHQLLLSQVQ